MDLMQVSTKNGSPAAPVPSTIDLADIQIQAIFQEYQALRTQITTLMGFEVQTVNFSIILIGVIVSAITQGGVMSFIQSNPEILLLTSALFDAIGVTNIYERHRIFRTAVYIDKILRENFKQLSGASYFFMWEPYLGKTYQFSTIARWLSHVRSTIFWTPASFLIGLACYYKWPVYSPLDVVSIIGSVLCLLFYVYASKMVSYSISEQICEQIMGVKAI